MRILVLGAGATGGYFGARLLAAGRDVTFLVRPARAAALARDGLRVASPHGDLHIAAPPARTHAEGPFDLVLLSCKAYDLAAAMQAVAPAMGPGTALLPLLNGMRHLDALDARFGRARVLGGWCAISAALEAGGVRHLNTDHALVFGNRDDPHAARIRAVAHALGGAGFDARASDGIVPEMWEKFVFLASLAGITCLMRAPVGVVVRAGGAALAQRLLDDCAAVAAAAGYPPRTGRMAQYRALLADPQSPFAASMARDIAGGGPTEADHVLGDMLRRAEAAGTNPVMLRAAAVHGAAYEAQRACIGPPGA